MNRSTLHFSVSVDKVNDLFRLYQADTYLDLTGHSYAANSFPYRIHSVTILSMGTAKIEEVVKCWLAVEERLPVRQRKRKQTKETNSKESDQSSW